MSYRRRHRWFRRMALGLAFASVMFAGRASVALAKVDPGTGSGSRYVVAGGWSGEVDMQSGVPITAGIPEGDEQFIALDSMQVIPYLSHGILTQEEADAAAAKAIHDPYPSSTLRGGKAEQLAMIPYLSHGLLTQADADAAAATTVHDPFPSSALQRGVVGDEIAFANAIVAAADSLHDPLTAEESLATSEQFVPGVTDFGRTTLQTAALRPDDRADRFAHSDVPPRPQMVSSDSGSTVDWNEALMVGFGALVLVLGLGLAIGYLRRPRIAGL